MMVRRTNSGQQPRADHRSRVGRERREKTRAKLLAAALPVFAKHGADAAIIDSIIQHAGVARGTFYNYFRTNDELFAAVAQEVSNELIRLVDPIVLAQTDPAARVACGVTLVVKLARCYPLLAEFIVRGGPGAIAAGILAAGVVPRDIAAGVAAGRFTVTDQRLAFDLILGPVIAALHTALTETISEQYPRELAASILRSLGVAPEAARKFANHDFGEFVLSEDSIFNRCQPKDAAN